ncbi:MAG: hypothetical protein V1853_04865, partial [bacterium]
MWRISLVEFVIALPAEIKGLKPAGITVYEDRFKITVTVRLFDWQIPIEVYPRYYFLPLEETTAVVIKSLCGLNNNEIPNQEGGTMSDIIAAAPESRSLESKQKEAGAIQKWIRSIKDIGNITFGQLQENEAKEDRRIPQMKVEIRGQTVAVVVLAIDWLQVIHIQNKTGQPIEQMYQKIKTAVNRYIPSASSAQVALSEGENHQGNFHGLKVKLENTLGIRAVDMRATQLGTQFQANAPPTVVYEQDLWILRVPEEGSCRVFTLTLDSVVDQGNIRVGISDALQENGFPELGSNHQKSIKKEESAKTPNPELIRLLAQRFRTWAGRLVSTDSIVCGQPFQVRDARDFQPPTFDEVRGGSCLRILFYGKDSWGFPIELKPLRAFQPRNLQEKLEPQIHTFDWPHILGGSTICDNSKGLPSQEISFSPSTRTSDTGKGGDSAPGNNLGDSPPADMVADPELTDELKSALICLAQVPEAERFGLNDAIQKALGREI